MPSLLSVEPDKQLASIIKKYMTNKGLEVTVSHSAQEAISSADKQAPDLVLLELAMPKNNGIAFLQEFRSYADWTDIPIIIYSRISQEDTGLITSEWAKYGVVGYFYKSTTTLESLLVNIRKSLSSDEVS